MALILAAPMVALVSMRLLTTGNDAIHSFSALLTPKRCLRPFVILSRPRIFESEFRNHCAKKLVGALRKPTSFK